MSSEEKSNIQMLINKKQCCVYCSSLGADMYTKLALNLYSYCFKYQC